MRWPQIFLNQFRVHRHLRIQRCLSLTCPVPCDTSEEFKSPFKAKISESKAEFQTQNDPQEFLLLSPPSCGVLWRLDDSGPKEGPV